jgi:uncharacterized protein YdbL (DUF1318 family)
MNPVKRQGDEMKTLRIPLLLLPLLFVAACVTINVYFPAEAAEKAADRIILDVYGEQPEKAPEPGSMGPGEGGPSRRTVSLLDWFIPPAQAAGADISVESPAIRQLKSEMESRHRKLAPFYTSGAIGMTRDGEIEVRDQKLVPLKDRNMLKQLVAKENRDRSALYAEIARANGHPEWEGDIRQTFARRWIDNAPSGWWYMDASGGWKQK